MHATRWSAPARHVGADSTVLQGPWCRRLSLGLLGTLLGFSSLSLRADMETLPSAYGQALTISSDIFTPEPPARPLAEALMPNVFKDLVSVKLDTPTGPQKLSAVHWQRVKKLLAKTYSADGALLDAVVLASVENGEKNGFDPLLLLAVIAVESRFDPSAQSHRGAQGLMQVIPRYHQDKLKGKHVHKNGLFDPITNIRVGALVLKEGIRRRGSLNGALDYYSGGRRSYAKEVFALRNRFERAAFIGDQPKAAEPLRAAL